MAAALQPSRVAIQQRAYFGFKRPPVLLFAGCSLFFMLVAMATQSMGRLCLACASISGLGILVVLDHVMASVAPDMVLPRIVNGAYALQYAWLTVAAVAGVTVDPAFSLGRLDLADAPLSATLPNLIVPAAACFVTIVLAVTIPRKATETRIRRSIWQETAEPPAGIELYLIAAAVLQVAFVWWAGAARDLPAYLVRVMHATLVFAPIFVGRYARVLKRVLYVWLLAMGAVFILGFFSGERFDALVPPGLCAIGYLSACPPRRRAKALLFTCALGILMLAISGVMARVRGEIGRGRDTDGSLISWSRVDRTLGTVQQVLSSEHDNDASSAAIWRMVSWPNYAVARLSPDTVPYAGWSDFPNQVQYTLFNLALFSGATVQDRIDMGLATAPARVYGYTITETNSYEWGLLGDGWYRGGIFGVWLFGCTLSIMLGVCELSLPFLRRLSPVLPLLLFILWICVAISVVTIPFLNECRTMIYNTPFLVVSVFFIELMRRTVLPRSQRISTGVMRIPVYQKAAND